MLKKIGLFIVLVAAGAVLSWRLFPPRPEGASPDVPKLTPLPLKERVAFSDSNERLRLFPGSAPFSWFPIFREVLELSQLLIKPSALGDALSLPLDSPPSPV